MTTHLARTFTRKDKYATVAGLLRGQAGTLLDVGARDRILSRLLDLNAITYLSADLGSGHDYQINLEETLSLPELNFDYVVALDVLEHIEHIHRAFHELARLARKRFIIALPNVASLPRRWLFLWRGNLGTGKYDLLPEHQGDRHRWLTVYSEINAFVRVNAERAGFRLDAMIEEYEPGRAVNRLARYTTALGLFRKGEWTERCIYVMTRL